jgi:putative transposase
MPCFFTDENYYCYLHWLKESARACGAIHACALMTNHVHLLLTPKEALSVDRGNRSKSKKP